jgi:hypothetical protein
MEVNGQPHSLAALPPGKQHLVPTEKETGCAPEPVWTYWYYHARHLKHINFKDRKHMTYVGRKLCGLEKQQDYNSPGNIQTSPWSTCIFHWLPKGNIAGHFGICSNTNVTTAQKMSKTFAQYCWKQTTEKFTMVVGKFLCNDTLVPLHGLYFHCNF